MATPESVREGLNLPPNCLPGYALVDVVYRDARIKEFHERAGVRVVAPMSPASAYEEPLDHIVTFSEDSPYLAALHAVRRAVAYGEKPPDSVQQALRLLRNATFDESEWATYLPTEDA